MMFCLRSALSGRKTGVFVLGICNWVGICPGNNRLAGKSKSSHVKKANRYLFTALVQSAWGAIRKRDSAFTANFDVGDQTRQEEGHGRDRSRSAAGGLRDAARRQASSRTGSEPVARAGTREVGTAPCAASAAVGRPSRGGAAHRRTTSGCSECRGE